ncbi:MAG: T9SS type A sorting domain-containing protein, partial [Bacteroidia bacterium]
NEYTNNNNISIYPNPTNGSFNIFTSEKIKNGRVEVYNSLGVLVCNKQIANEQTAIELNDQANGLYFVKMMSEGKIIDTHKIIKEN